VLAVPKKQRLVHALAAPALAPALAWADHPAGTFGPDAGGPVLVPTADVLPTGGWSAPLYTEYRRFDVPEPDALEAQALAAGHVHSLRYLLSPSLAASYGVTDRLTLSVRLPYVKRADLAEAHVHHGRAGVHDLGDSAGPGDLSLSAYWRLWDDRRGNALALSAGSFVPTGSTDEVDAEGARFPTEHQPGTGAWRPFLGLTYSHSADRMGLHAHARYTWATEGAQRTDLGDRLDYGLALVYRLTSGSGEEPHHHDDDVEPHHHDDPPAGVQWDLLLEVSGEYQRPQRVDGVVEGHSEQVVFLAPGLRVSGNGGWTAALSLGLPIYQEVGHEHIKTDWRAVAAVGYSF
jgi:hypothetical protein